ncbi:MAG: hypothetical protein ABIJ00_10030 [Candidatus Eisenbacteria bacterium]
MIRRSRFFKTASWVCIALAANACTYEIVLGQSSGAGPATAATVTGEDPGESLVTLDKPYVQLAQSDTTGISMKTDSVRPGRIRFVLLPGRDGLGTLRPSSETSSSASSTGVGDRTGDRRRSDSNRIWLLPGREAPDTPDATHWRRTEPEAGKPSGDVPPLSVADGPLASENQPGQPPPVYKRWWFWTIAVLVIGTAAAILAGAGGTDEDDSGKDLPGFPGPPD